MGEGTGGNGSAALSARLHLHARCIATRFWPLDKRGPCRWPSAVLSRGSSKFTACRSASRHGRSPGRPLERCCSSCEHCATTSHERSMARVASCSASFGRDSIPAGVSTIAICQSCGGSPSRTAKSVSMTAHTSASRLRATSTSTSWATAARSVSRAWMSRFDWCSAVWYCRGGGSRARAASMATSSQPSAIVMMSSAVFSGTPSMLPSLAASAVAGSADLCISASEIGIG